MPGAGLPSTYRNEEEPSPVPGKRIKPLHSNPSNDAAETVTT